LWVQTFLYTFAPENKKRKMNMEANKNMVERTTLKNESIGLMAFILICSLMMIGLS